MVGVVGKTENKCTKRVAYLRSERAPTHIFSLNCSCTAVTVPRALVVKQKGNLDASTFGSMEPSSDPLEAYA